MNAGEVLRRAQDWLGWHDENFVEGLRNAFDALRLYDYAQAHPGLPEVADSWEEADLVAAVGYNPHDKQQPCAKTSGVDVAASAMHGARTLLDSVAFLTSEGDKDQPLAALDAALGLHAGAPA